MKKIFFVLLCTAFTFLLTAQDKRIYSVEILKPKPGKVLDLEKALKEHTTKFHPAGKEMYIYELVAGPNAGSYQLVMGPMSWGDMDNERTDYLDHLKDWELKLSQLIEGDVPLNYYAYNADLSYNRPTAPTKKSRLQMTHIKSGMMSQYMEARREWIDAMKKASPNINSSFYVRQMAGSNPVVVSLNEFPNGWVDMEEGKSPNMQELLVKQMGQDKYQRYIDKIDACIESREIHLRVFRQDLSSTVAPRRN
jgi:hypothetical protein